jgi:hypothetical protein
MSVVIENNAAEIYIHILWVMTSLISTEGSVYCITYNTVCNLHTVFFHHDHLPHWRFLYIPVHTT